MTVCSNYPLPKTVGDFACYESNLRKRNRPCNYCILRLSTHPYLPSTPPPPPRHTPQVAGSPSTSLVLSRGATHPGVPPRPRGFCKSDSTSSPAYATQCRNCFPRLMIYRGRIFSSYRPDGKHREAFQLSQIARVA